MTDRRFAGDRGAADPALLEALATVADVADAAGSDLAAQEARLLSLLAGARLLVPVLPAPTSEPHPSADVHGVPGIERGQTEMATVMLTGPDGSTALPAFTSVDAMAAWDPSARPVPVTAAAAARAALDDGCAVVLLDLGSDHAGVLRPSMLWALAQEREWLPPYADPLVRAALAHAVAAAEDLVTAQALDGSRRAAGVTEIEVGVPAGLAPERIEHLVLSLGEQLSADPDVRCRLDDLAIRLTVIA